VQLRNVDANLIIALGAPFRHQNVTRAAKRWAQSALGESRAGEIARALRDPLLVPVGRRLILSERARELLEPVTAAIAKLERVFAPAEPFDPRTSRRVFRIAATDNLVLYVLPHFAANLNNAAPRIELRVAPLTPDWPAALQSAAPKTACEKDEAGSPRRRIAAPRPTRRLVLASTDSKAR
jgi:DNA-binding transcriptional LysR family regulator